MLMWLIATVVVFGGVALANVAVAVREPDYRRASALSGLGCLIWGGISVGTLTGMPDAWFWGLGRPAVLLVFLAASSGLGHAVSPREAWETLVEGWLQMAGLVGFAWILVREQNWLPVREDVAWTLAWLLPVLLMSSFACGIAVRAERGQRRAAAMAVAAAVLALLGDVLALATRTEAGIPLWAASAVVMAQSTVWDAGNVFRNPVLAIRPRRLRWWQLPIPFAALLVLFPGQPADPVTGVLLTGISIAVFANMIGQSGQSERLWDDLTARSELYEELLEDTQDVILQVDDFGVIEFANPASQRVLGMRPEQLVGTTLMDYLHRDDQRMAGTVAGAPQWRRGEQRVETRFLPVLPGVPAEVPEPPRQQGVLGNLWAAHESRWRVIEWGITPRDDGGAVLVGRDVSDRVRMQGELLDAAQTDSLTGLLNRTAFLEAVNTRLAAGEPVAVMFIDLDNFKEVNDTMGHAEGDRLLHRAAECLRQAAGPGDAVARLGGDEFAVMPASATEDAARAAADAVVTAFNGFDESAHGRPSVSASLGLVIADPAVTRTAREVLRDADLAMYRAKQRGGAGVVDFEPWMSERVMEHHRLRGDLETAVRDESLSLYLQPVVDLHTRQWEGFEALVRWPVGAETWSPAQFLPVAEESGLIVPMGAWVLRESLRQLAGWRDPRLGMAVNVSAQQLVGTDFYDITMEALTDSGIAPDRLTLEITEQAAIQDLGRTASRLELLRSEGVHVAIDDFGTGFSSLQYLSRLPVDILKIDRKFVWGLGQQAEDDVLVRSMLGLAAELGLEVIAEGVETRRQAELLLEYGCRLAQGFLFSPPRPIEELRASDPFVSPAPPMLAMPYPRPSSDQPVTG
ncbi:putative bifunctional diguanylate cyclase/phosphodiesterase [Kineosporia succinea]|uniref:Diguanylate cyclase (GGDEF)-like protein n=1 Tax=Kineosporia succinea TaxID=84632 RepID=A0ABT9NWJ5_9ACTN|nr:EAL domain-containing protein [Kineosporia succinea]MDP9824798.1 diguanylate cyclase (GGDEF)-like protein [Kineosporia succinea]